MANRLIRKTAILLEIETTYGTDPTPTGAANAMLVSNVSINPLNAQNVDRDLIRSYLGGSEQLLGTAYIEMSFDLEYQSSGTLGVAPPWGPALRACGFAEAVTADTRIDYTPVSDAFESCTIYWYDDGVLHKALGCRGTFELMAGVGERPVFRFRFLGIDGGISAAANPALTLTAWQQPKVITDANTGDLTFGGTYSAGAITGGTPYPSRGLALNVGNEINFTPLLGGETVDLSNRAVTGSVPLDLTAAEEVTFMGLVKANTLGTISMLHGTANGFKMLIHAAGAQKINPSKQEINGKRLIGYDLRLVPSTGNDELRIVAL
jgi:hypothetical protein